MFGKFLKRRFNRIHLIPARTGLKFSVYSLSALALALSLVFIAPYSASTASASSPAAAQPAAVPGAIAYVNSAGTQIHLVNPDGSNDHVIWSAPMVGSVQSGVRYPAFSPDGSQIAFTSDMEQTVSLLQSDIFAINPDGSGLRAITDPPLTSNLGSFQTGTVNVQVSNQSVGDSLFIIYVDGAKQPQSTTVPMGSTKTVTFNDVAIFPGHSQFAVAINGITRWIGFPDTPTFQPGTTNGATITLNSGGYDNFGAIKPVWSSDSSEIDYTLGESCTGQAISAHPDPGANLGQLLVPFSASMCYMDRGPTAALANQVIYFDYLGNFPNGAFMQAAVGAAQPTMLFDTGYASASYGVKWLPDGSGILYSLYDGNCDCSNIYHYDFGAKKSTQITQFTSQYTGNLSISPDGQAVVFELFNVLPNPTLNPDAVPDLWIMNVDGSNQSLLVQQARDPSWGQTSTLPAMNNHLYLPLIDKH